MEWLVPVASQFSASGFEHCILNRRALILLKHLSPSLPFYLEQRVFLIFRIFSGAFVFILYSAKTQYDKTHWPDDFIMELGYLKFLRPSPRFFMYYVQMRLQTYFIGIRREQPKVEICIFHEYHLSGTSSIK